MLLYILHGKIKVGILQKSYEKQIVYDIANSFKKNKFDIIKQNFELMKLNKSHPQWLGDYKEIYLYLVNLLLTVQNKFLFIIVDAINENDSDGFGNQISAFINKIADYSRAKIVVSCRNEYYKERFRKYLVEKVNIPVFEFDLKEQHYTSTAINRIIKTCFRWRFKISQL